MKYGFVYLAVTSRESCKFFSITRMSKTRFFIVGLPLILSIRCSAFWSNPVCSESSLKVICAWTKSRKMESVVSFSPSTKAEIDSAKSAAVNSLSLCSLFITVSRYSRVTARCRYPLFFRFLYDFQLWIALAMSLDWCLLLPPPNKMITVLWSTP